jgi:hypothetical protein
VNVTKEIGKFYQKKKQWNTAIGYYENRMLKGYIDMETNLLLLQSYTEAKEFEKSSKKSDGYGGFSQPQFYYYSGLAYNQLAI